MTDTLAPTKHAIARVRHEPRRRLLTVQQVRAPHPAHGPHHARRRPRGLRQRRLRRSRQGVLSAARAATPRRFRSRVPTESRPEGVERSPGRDYTPRRYDVDRNELVIDFRAARRRPGHELGGTGRARPATQHRRTARLVRRRRTISTGTCSSATRPRCRRSPADSRNCVRAHAPWWWRQWPARRGTAA